MNLLRAVVVSIGPPVTVRVSTSNGKVESATKTNSGDTYTVGEALTVARFDDTGQLAIIGPA
jgi:hypothetical protein